MQTPSTGIVSSEKCAQSSNTKKVHISVCMYGKLGFFSKNIWILCVPFAKGYLYFQRLLTPNLLTHYKDPDMRIHKNIQNFL